MGAQASYLMDSAANPFERVPEMSRRARGVPIWAALASLGADGVIGLVDGLVDAAQGIAAGVAAIPGARIVNDVDFTQVSVAFETDERTRAVYDADPGRRADHAVAQLLARAGRHPVLGQQLADRSG